jgi:xylulokinase
MPLLGIDVGTGGTRALLIDEAGRVLAAAAADHAPFVSPQPAWAEQHPLDWWRAAQEAIRAVLAASACDPRTISGIGLSGQMHGAVVLDRRADVVRPAIIWCDQRTAAQCAWLNETIGPAPLLAHTANPALTNFTLPKLLWLREHEPEAWARVRHVLLPKDYVRFRLSGTLAMDVTDASGTLMLDVTQRRWSTPVLDASGVPATLLPQVFESADVCASVCAEGARATGLVAGTPIVAGAGDQAAGAVGVGVTRPGVVSATIGTSGVVFAATDRPAFDPRGRVHTFCHAAPSRWHVMGVTQAAGLSLRWLREQLGSAGDGYDALAAEAEHAPPGSAGVLWAPYLMGERTPHVDPDARAALVGLTASHGRAHIIRAVLEGVAFSLRDTFTIFDEMAVPIAGIRLGGGGARSALWRQIQADVYGRPVETVASDEGAAYGAAVLAGVGAGVWPGVDDACDRLIRTRVAATPDPASEAVLQQRYLAYRRLYPLLRALYEPQLSPVST